MQSNWYLKKGETEALNVWLYNASKVGITGETPTIRIRRQSDGYYWNGSAFVSSPSDPTMTESDATNSPGLYTYSWSVPNAIAQYSVRVLNAANATLPPTQEMYAVDRVVPGPTIPLSSVVSAGQVVDTAVPVYQYSLLPDVYWDITDDNEDPVDLSGYTLITLTVFTTYGVTFFSADDGGIGGLAVSGASNNRVTWTRIAAHVANDGAWHYRLDADTQVIATGNYSVMTATA